MTCQEFTRNMHRLADGELGDEETQGLRAHADACERCAAGLQSLLRLRHTLRGSACEDLSPGARARIVAALLTTAVQQKAAAGPNPEVMTLDEVATYLRVSDATVRQSLGRIPHFTVGGELRFRRQSIEAWIEREEQHTAPGGLTGPVLTLVTGENRPAALAG